ncbi:MAG: hypothetical protein COA71_13205 [SAR86 cluster bacterium]|uniref:Uncharacterized protein n=1 Tax=SAR86 cluster bacterium TaxID=2030880 RepID=A0A2A5C8Y1_9GAMM|nr:hypothetical protein [Gammaproteobacteria bacterium AH-315-E17]PCJ39836.1 MAG: hypothetical protein COA71_13205 [SAR86 cluster bacterium]
MHKPCFSLILIFTVIFLSSCCTLNNEDLNPSIQYFSLEGMKDDYHYQLVSDRYTGTKVALLIFEINDNRTGGSWNAISGEGSWISNNDRLDYDFEGTLNVTFGIISYNLAIGRYIQVRMNNGIVSVSQAALSSDILEDFGIL